MSSRDTRPASEHGAGTGKTAGKRIAKWVAFVVVAGALGVLGYVIFGRIQDVQSARANDARDNPAAPAVVVVVPVAPHDFTDTLDVSGEIHAARTVQVLPKLGGRILELPITLGQSIRAGDLVARLEENDLGWRSKQAQAGERAANAGVKLASVQAQIARTEALRADQLHKQSALTEADLTRARGGRDMAEAQVGLARAQAEVAHAMSGLAADALSWTVVTSPFDGVITRRWTEAGAMAGPTTPLIEVQDQSTLRIEVDAPARALSALPLGATVLFRVDELGDKHFEATVKAVSKSLDPQTRRARVELEVPGARVGDGVLPAMLATVEVKLSAKAGVLGVPRQAVVNLADGPALFAVRDGKAVRLKVTPADGDRTHVPLVAGTGAGEARAEDVVVIEGQDGLADGMPVQIGKGAGPK